MKNLSLFIVAIILLQLNVFSQTVWFQQVSGTTHELYSVFFVDIDTGCSVSEYGEILRIKK